MAAPELIVEDGSGLADANTYCSQARADEINAGNFYGAGWATMTDDQKRGALITATRMLDQQWQWAGDKKTEEQALQWPRTECPDPDHAGGREFMPDDEVPKAIVDATALYALAIFGTNFEAQPQGQGISDFTLDGVMSVTFDLSTTMEMVPRWIQSELMKYGSMTSAKNKTVKVVRT